jgi:hypothetical protein
MARSWKATERRCAKFFGSERTPLSGGNSKHTRSDSLSPHIFIESKSSKKSAIWSLFKKTRPLAKAEKKPCVLITHCDNHEGFLITFHSGDLQEVIEAFIKTGAFDPTPITSQKTDSGFPPDVLEDVQSLSPTSDPLPDSPVPGRKSLRRTPGR